MKVDIFNDEGNGGTVMQEVFEKIIEKLSNLGWVFADYYPDGTNISRVSKKSISYDEVVEMVRQVDAEYNNGWIPCSERLPENEKHKGVFCPRYWLMTKYGQTVGWYNPDRESWFVLVWFMTGRHLKEEIDLERGDVPKLVRAPLNTGIVIAWQPLPEPYQPKGE